MAEIIPTILTSDFDEFSQKINLVREIVPRVQIDVIDGKFAPKKTVDLEGMRDLNDMGDLRIDLHLMVDKPEEWVNRCLELLPDRIVGQVETMKDTEEFLNKVIEGGVEAGIALDIETPVGVVSDEIYHMVDLIVILGVKAGKSGQVFNPAVLEKIINIKKIVGDLVKIGVDGGLDETNISLCQEAGAEMFYVGSNFWEAPNQNGSGQAEDLKKRYNELLKLLVYD